jgi:hypothetical protein
MLCRIPLGPHPSLHRLRCGGLGRSGAPRCSPTSQLLRRGPTSRVRASSASAPRLPDADHRTRRPRSTPMAKPETSQLPVRSFCTPIDTCRMTCCRIFVDFIAPPRFHLPWLLAVLRPVDLVLHTPSTFDAGPKCRAAVTLLQWNSPSFWLMNFARCSSLR